MAKISVIIPCYKQAHLLPKAIESVLVQADETSVEVVVVDDGSPDRVEDAVAPFLSKLRFVKQKNGGLSCARNAGVAAATGDYLLFLDSDDWLERDAIRRFRESGASQVDADVYYGGWRYADENGENSAVHEPANMDADPFHALLLFNPAPCHCYLVRADAVRRSGQFDTTLNSNEDWDLWLRLAAQQCRFKQLRGSVGVYRRTAGSMSTNRSRMAQTGIRVLKKQRHTHVNCRGCDEVIHRRINELRTEYLHLLSAKVRNNVKSPPVIKQVTLELFASLVHDPSLLRVFLSMGPHALARLIQSRPSQTSSTP